MKIALCASGSRGDVQPMLDLALRLREEGHEVRVCATPTFAAWSERLGLPFHPVGVDVEKLLKDAAARGSTSTLALIREFDAWLVQETAAHFAALPEALQGVELVVGAGMQIAAPSVAELLGVPFRYVAYCPVMLPSAAHPPILLPWQRMPPLVNRLLWRWFLPTYNGKLKRLADPHRLKLGLAPIPDYFARMMDGVIVAADPELAPVPSDTGLAFEQTGFFAHTDETPLPSEVERFLAAGPPPIYVGFGSMTDPEPLKTTRTIAEAALMAGVRVVLSRGWAGLGHGELPAEVLVVESVPHGALFPRLAGVVHHGGAGTTAAAGRAGVPQLVVPHLMDQFYWGARLFDAGVAARPIPRTKLDASKLADAFRQLSDERLGERARAVGERLRARDGLSATVAVLTGSARGTATEQRQPAA